MFEERNSPIPEYCGYWELLNSLLTTLCASPNLRCFLRFSTKNLDQEANSLNRFLIKLKCIDVSVVIFQVGCLLWMRYWSCVCKVGSLIGAAYWTSLTSSWRFSLWHFILALSSTTVLAPGKLDLPSGSSSCCFFILVVYVHQKGFIRVGVNRFGLQNV